MFFPLVKNGLLCIKIKKWRRLKEGRVQFMEKDLIINMEISVTLLNGDYKSEAFIGMSFGDQA